MSLTHRGQARIPLLLAGPTAVGKSGVALCLAERLPGEIVSVDSMQVYRGLNLGTAKPSPAERARVPHHLIDVVDLTESFDAARFVGLAREAVAGIQSRGLTPILCGGTGLYFKALLCGLGNSPPTDPQLRNELENTPLPELLAELHVKDPVTYARIDRQNRRRVTRALEVTRIAGRAYSELRANWADSSRQETQSERCGAFPEVMGMARSLEDLRQRIDARVEDMFQRGLVTETSELLRQGLERNKTAMQALGYRQVMEHLRGERPLGPTIELVKTRTRRYAKRQMTWFRRQLAVTWIPVGPQDRSEQIAERVQTAYFRATAEPADPD